VPIEVFDEPTTTWPFADAANPELIELSPGKSPNPTNPPADVQRNAWDTVAEV
jgi:hypothetical protein